jgi:hypothetical protein
MTKQMTLRQCFNFLEANNVLLYVEKDSATGRNHIVLTFSRKDGDGRRLSTGYARTPVDADIPFEEVLPLLCQTAKDKYEGLKDE